MFGVLIIVIVLLCVLSFLKLKEDGCSCAYSIAVISQFRHFGCSVMLRLVR